MAIPEIKKFECPVLRDTLLAPVMLFPLMAGALIQRLSYFWGFGAGAVLMGLSLVMALCLRDLPKGCAGREGGIGICRGEAERGHAVQRVAGWARVMAILGME